MIKIIQKYNISRLVLLFIMSTQAHATNNHGKWIKKNTVPPIIQFQQIEKVAEKNTFIVSNGKITKYISGFSTQKEGYKAGIDTLKGLKQCTEEDVKTVKNSLTTPSSNSAKLNSAIDRFSEAVQEYCDICSSVNSRTPIQINHLKESQIPSQRISQIIKQIPEKYRHSEMAFFIDYNNTTQDIWLATSRLDMCESCEMCIKQVSSQISSRQHPYTIFIQSFLVYGQGGRNTRASGNHDNKAILFKVATEGNESSEAVNYSESK